jgi:hypothetical protein
MSVNRYSITGEAELRMRVSYDYDSDMIKPAKVKLVTMPNRQFEDVADADLLISYYEQRAAHMMATDESSHVHNFLNIPAERLGFPSLRSYIDGVELIKTFKPN